MIHARKRYKAQGLQAAELSKLDLSCEPVLVCGWQALKCRLREVAQADLQDKADVAAKQHRRNGNTDLGVQLMMPPHECRARLALQV